MTTTQWIITGIVAWIVVAVLVAVLICRIIRNRNRQTPSPNHAAMRAHKQHITERPLTYEAVVIAELEKQFAPDTQESQ
jgi:flagellar biosynthesis/type III secretory pathway M-ring protein FliF/YscJ